MSNLLSLDQESKSFLLQSILDDFYKLDLIPVVGIELEFYLVGDKVIDQKIIAEFIVQLKLQLDNQRIIVQGIEPEQGLGQVEIKTLPYQDILALCQDILLIKAIVINLAQNFSSNLSAIFTSQPFIDDCGSALQINLSLVSKNSQDLSNHYLFAKNSFEESKYLLHAIAGILTNIKNLLLIAAPTHEDYPRFDRQLNNQLYKNKKYTAPVNISWGYDNRTALIRIPTTKEPSVRRLEFRLPSADSDVYLMTSFLLLAVLFGIEVRISPPPAIYGNAFDEQYDLEKLINNFAVAKQSFFNNNPLLDLAKEKLILKPT